VPTQQTIFPFVGGIFRTSHKRLVRVKTEEGDVTETDIDIKGWIILEGFEKKKSGKKRKIEQEGEPSDELETLSISSAESGHRQKAAPEFKLLVRDLRRQLLDSMRTDRGSLFLFPRSDILHCSQKGKLLDG